MVLLTLEKTVDGCVRFEDFTSNPGFYALGYERNLKKASLAQALKRLRENGFIEFLSDNELKFKLTDKGKNKALWIKMKTGNEKWDGKWRIVAWDIPEKRKKIRDLLRNQLKQLGFKQLQRSVWVSKKNCAQLLKEYIKKVGIEDWVQVLESDKIEI